MSNDSRQTQHWQINGRQFCTLSRYVLRCRTIYLVTQPCCTPSLGRKPVPVACNVSCWSEKPLNNVVKCRYRPIVSSFVTCQTHRWEFRSGNCAILVSTDLLQSYTHFTQPKLLTNSPQNCSMIPDSLPLYIVVLDALFVGSFQLRIRLKMGVPVKSNNDM